MLSAAAAGRDIRLRMAKPAFPKQPGAGCVLGTAARPWAGRQQQERCKILLPTTTDEDNGNSLSGIPPAVTSERSGTKHGQDSPGLPSLGAGRGSTALV